MLADIGQRFGPYEILGRLGGGGMGLVFRAWDKRLEREVAVKLLHDDYTMPGMRERFLQEARAASALNHPNICTVFDIGEQDRSPYLVMELLEGETVKDRIERGALSADEIIRCAMEIADALTAAHTKGIVHRDIKPANIFLVSMPNGKRQTKVLDFGLAKMALEAHREQRSRGLTMAGSTVGTLSYMSPEQARGEPLDIRSDLFSLGIVLYEMATRQVPFQGATSALMFVQLFSHTPESIRNWNESIPRALEKVIFKLLEKNPKKRFQTAKELHEALAKAGSRVERGGWQSKGSVPVVPLVRTSDPVAWHRGQKRTSSHDVVVTGSTPDTLMARPVRSPGKDRGGVEVTAMHFLRTKQIPIEKAEASAQPRGGSAVMSAVRPIAVASYSKQPLSRLATGITQFEFYLDEADFEVGPAKEAAEKEGLQELIAASSEVSSRTQFRMVFAAVLILVGVVAVSLVCSGMFRPLVLSSNDHLLLTVIENRTGDKTLDGTVMQGLEIALRQSKSLNVLGGEAYRAGLKQVEVENGAVAEMGSEQRVAQDVGARAYLYGEIKGSKAPYRISVDVLKSDSNDKVETFEETAAGRNEIPAAIGRLALDIRGAVSGDLRPELKSSVPLEREATANVEALHAYAMGEAARQSGRMNDALADYREAAKLDPQFAEAQIRLAWLFGAEKAEVASANAAEMARNSAAKASDKVKLLAQFCYEMNASGDYERALEIIRGYLAQYPLEVDGRKGLARVLRAQGNLPEALRAAEQGYVENPFDAEMYAEAELDMIGMDRYESALQLEAQAERVGVAAGGYALTSGYLADKADVIAQQGNAMQVAVAGMADAGGTRATYAELYRYGLYLDNTGRTDEGLELWKSAAARASATPEFASTQASMLAQGALDRALMENCTVALQLIDEAKDLPKGPVAMFNAGLTSALCGDQASAEKASEGLLKRYPKSAAVAQYYVPQLEAGAEIGVNEPEKAVDSLTALEDYDQMSLSAYLRGTANAALGQMPAAVRDFRIVLAHRGMALISGGTAYPMAEIGTARIEAMDRNKKGSIESYRRFLTLWHDADQSQPLIAEASSKSKPTNTKGR
jgi:eukaryotic-like serine/threonine-protein kinase